MNYIVTALAALLLVGCDFEYYRYACQNPDNWDTAECQKPQCEVRQTCPEHIFKKESSLVKAAAIDSVVKTAPVANKGGCK